MESPRNITATEIDELMKDEARKWNDICCRLIEPILDRVLELARAHGTKA